MESADEETPLIHYLRPQDEGPQYTSDGTVDINKKPALKRGTGNWRACYLILGAEINESLAFSGIQKNLVTYLTSVLHESNVDAATNVSTWLGSCFFTPLVGAFLADTYWGRYWTVVIFISIQAIGMVALTVSTWLPLLMDSSSFNSSSTHRAAVYLGLYLIAIGSGGIKPCTSALGADQFDGADPAERVNKGSFFNWFFFSINLGSLLSSTALVWVQDNVGWGVGFAIPMALTVFGLAVFVAGRKVYRFLDKAAIVARSSSDEKGAASTVSPWRLCTVSQVKELKMLLRLFPVWASMVLFFAVTSQASSTFIEQGMAMDNRVGPFTVPPASLSIFHTISIIVGIPIYDAALVPLARRVTGDDRGLSQLRRLGVGLALSVTAMAYAALVEARRLAAASAATTSIVWQVPSFALVGAAEVFTTTGVLEFFYDQSPGGMKSTGTSLAHLAIAAGSYLNSAVLGAVAWATARGGAPGWIPDDLNEGHLDYSSGC
ncbi:protein NRT1/ PTR FAMILY 8.3-like [Panicum miliaceum]|uniref:Protein NRT1/ PTR FAMILY 8.3-like n=1 Tax=Panicum miliaceum TaxID=4540 RepID=A0A3L6SR64_PANMI|nr:protein NRT1/ PTR FAMILY 8.3-like [Panicum miliaceum]